MAWTSPRTWVPQETVTSTMLNAHLRDNLNVLKTRIADDGTLRPGPLFADATDHATSGTGETDLVSWTMPAGTVTGVWDTNEQIHIEIHGICTNQANGKTIRLYVGTSTLAFTAVATAQTQWLVRATITRTGASTQRIKASLEFYNAGGTSGSGNQMLNADGTNAFASSMVIKVSGQMATAGSITSHMFAARRV